MKLLTSLFCLLLSTLGFAGSPKVDKFFYGSEPAVRFEAGGYEAILLPGYGSTVISLYHHPSKSNLLHTPDSTEMERFYKRPQIYGTPLLFPPNRIEDGTYQVGDMKYQFPITIKKQNCHHHGYLKSQAFELAAARVYSDSVVLVTEFVSDETHGTIFAHFPHRFRCRMILTLSSEGMRQEVRFTNLGERPMPLGFGYHTPLCLPFQGETDKYALLLSAGDQWEMNDRFLPTKKRVLLSENLKKLRYSGMDCKTEPIEVALSDNPLHFDGKPYRGAMLLNHHTRDTLCFEVEKKFIHWTLWNNQGKAPYVCPEPQTWVTNAPNLDLPQEESGFYLLPSQADWSATIRLYIRDH